MLIKEFNKSGNDYFIRDTVKEFNELSNDWKSNFNCNNQEKYDKRVKRFYKENKDIKYIVL